MSEAHNGTSVIKIALNTIHGNIPENLPILDNSLSKKTQYDLLTDYTVQLNQWICNAPSEEERLGRELAAERIRECYLEKSSRLNLNNLGITSVRGLTIPLWINALDLRGNQINSFEEMPNLPQLFTLYLSDNQIRSFKGMPNLPKLTNLYISNNQIISFKGMPNLPELTNFYISITKSDLSKKCPQTYSLIASQSQVTPSDR